MSISSRVAGRFLEARGVEADYGDVDAAHNVFEYFEAEGRKLENDEVLMLKGMLQEAIFKTAKKREDLVRKALKSNSADMKTLKSKGIRLK